MHRLRLFLLAGLTVVPTYTQVVTGQSPHRVSSGYVFYAPTASESSYLVGNDGAIAHSWPGSGPSGLAVKILPDGAILRSTTSYSARFFAGRGVGGKVERWTWDGKLEWSYVLPDSERYMQHHDVTALPNGNVLILAWEWKSAEEARVAGREAGKTSPDGIWSEAIFEVRPEPPEGGSIVWEWHVWDHLGKGPGRIDINFTGSTADPAGNPDWLHLNSVSYHPKRNQILLSSRPWSEIWIIDHGTTAAEAAGPAGDILYRWGNPQAYGAGTAADQRLFNQHDAHWIAEGLPGAEHILVLNNGVGRGYSSADEIVPPVDGGGRYAMGADGRYGPEGPLWTFGATAGAGFLTATAGSAQRLRNGNTLLCLSNANRVVEVTPEKEIVWNLNLGAGEAGGYTFRAQRIAVDEVQLAGTRLGGLGLELWNGASARRGVLAPGVLAGARVAGLELPITVTVTDASGQALAGRVSGTGDEVVLFEVPRRSAVGPARLQVTGSGGVTAERDFRMDAVSPGLFAANGHGEGVGAVIATVNGVAMPAYAVDPGTGRYGASPVPVNGEVYLSLFGTGLGAAGEVGVEIGGVAVPVTVVAALTEFPGMDQINAGPLPAGLAGKRDQPIVVTVGGVASNVVTISFQ